jgi:hypothetical protein
VGPLVHVVYNGKGNWRGYVGTCGLMNVLNLVVGKIGGLHRDLCAHECVVSSGGEINGVT